MNSLRMSFWMVPLSWSCVDALLLGRDDVAGQHRQHRAVHRHRHATSGRAGCRRTGSSCPRPSRSPRRPCRRRRRRAGGRCRSRGGWRGRRRPTRPGRRRRGCGGRRRSTPRRSRSRRTGGSSTAAPAYIVGCGPAHERREAGQACRRVADLARSAAVYSGLTAMPSGVCQEHKVEGSDPPGALFAAARSQSARVTGGNSGGSESAKALPRRSSGRAGQLGILAFAVLRDLASINRRSRRARVEMPLLRPPPVPSVIATGRSRF